MLSVLFEIFLVSIILFVWYLIFISIPTYLFLFIDYLKFLNDFFKGNKSKFNFIHFKKNKPELFKKLNYIFILISITFHMIFIFLIYKNQLKFSDYSNFFLEITFSMVGIN